MAEIHNYMEDLIAQIMEDLFADMPDVCKCEKCKLDILALSLNRLPSKYVVTEKGRLYTKLAELELQFRADIVKEITKAIGMVGSKPQH